VALKTNKKLDSLSVKGPKYQVLSLSGLRYIDYVWHNGRVIALEDTDTVTNFDSFYQHKIWSYGIHPLLNNSTKIIEANKLWGLGYNGSGIVIAILDTGIDKNHPDLDDLDDNPLTNDPKVIYEVSFVDYDYDGIPDEDPMDYHGHGTHCAGIAAGTGEASGYTYVGVAPGAYLMNVKVLDSSGGGYWDWIISGIEYATFGPDGIANTGDEADIISMSLGGAGSPRDPVSMAVNNAWDYGIIVVVAAGNSGSQYYTVASPAGASKVITVGATDKSGNLASFSSRGPSIELRMKPDIVAPGVSIIAPRANNTYMGSVINDYYTSASGTSMATPHVAGASALLLQAFPTSSNNEIKVAIMSSAVDLGYPSYAQGAGLLDVYAAYCFLNGTWNTVPVSVGERSAYEGSGGGLVTIENNWYVASFDSYLASDYFYYKPVAADNVFYESFAIRYGTGSGTYFYWFFDLLVESPLSIIYSDENATVAFGSLLTPDNSLRIKFYLFSTNEKWLNAYFFIEDISVGVSWVALYEGIDADVYYSASNNQGIYNSTYDAIYQYYVPNPIVYFGFSAVNHSNAHHLSSCGDMWDAIDMDTLNNANSYYGDCGMALKWNTTKIATAGSVHFQVVWGVGDNADDFLASVNEGKAIDFSQVESYLTSTKTVLKVVSIGYMIPMYTGDNTFNITISNLGNATAYNVNVSIFIDNSYTYSTTLDIPGSSSITLQTSISIIIPGVHIFEVFVIYNDSIVDDLKRPIIINGPRDIIVTPIELNSYPLSIIYGGQRVPYNLTIVLGEDLSDISIGITYPSDIILTANIINLDNTTGQYFVNLVIETNASMSPGTYAVVIDVIESSVVVYRLNILFEIVGMLPYSYSYSVYYYEESQYLGTSDYDGVIEGDEDVGIDISISNDGNISFVPTLVFGSTNDSDILIWDTMGTGYSVSPGYSDSPDDVDCYIMPRHPNGTLWMMGLIYLSNGTSYPYNLGVPVDYFELNISVRGRINGTPYIEFVNMTYYDDDNDGYWEPEEYLYVDITVMNSGNGSAVSIWIYGYDNYSEADIYTPGSIPAMDPGDSRTFTVEHYAYSSATSGTVVHATIYIYYYDIDLKHLYTTIIEYDLLIMAAGLNINYIEVPSYAIVGTTVMLNASVTYGGPDNTTTVTIRWLANGSIICDHTYVININETIIDSCYWTPSDYGHYKIEVIVEDPNVTLNSSKWIPTGYRLLSGPIDPSVGQYHNYYLYEVDPYDPTIILDYIGWFNISYVDRISTDLINATKTVSYYGSYDYYWMTINTTDRHIVEGTSWWLDSYYILWYPLDCQVGDIITYWRGYGVIVDIDDINVMGQTFSAYRLVYLDLPMYMDIAWIDADTNIVLNVLEKSDYWAYRLELKDTNIFTIIDTQPPDINIYSPTNNSYVGTSDVTIYWYGYDASGIDHYEVKLDDGSWINVGLSTSYTFYNLQCGEHIVYVKAIDNNNNVGVVSIIFTVDTTPPSISITAPLNNSEVGDTLSVYWEASDDISYVFEVKVYLNDSLVATFVKDVNMTDHLKLTGLQTSKYYVIKVVVYDAVGLFSCKRVIIKTNAYGVFITFPGDEAMINVTYLRLIWSYGGSPDNFTIRVNGSLYAFLLAPADNVNITGLYEGAWTITITAKYKTGTYTDSVMVYVDLTQPTVTITYPLNGDFLNTSDVTLTWNMDDQLTGIDYCEIIVDGSVYNVGALTEYTIYGLREGLHTVTVKVFDRAGNSDSDMITFTIDLTPPTIVIISPENNTEINTNTITISWDITDNYGIAYIKYRVDQGVWNNVGIVDGVTIELSDGTHSISIVAVDLAGNTKIVTLVITVSTGMKLGYLLPLVIAAALASVIIIMFYRSRKRKIEFGYGFEEEFYL